MTADDATKPERTVTDGARALRSYLDAKSVSITVFCETNGLDRVQVQRVLNGERGKRITVDFADAIAQATNGEVPITAWKSRTEAPVAPGSSPAVPSSADDSGQQPAVGADPAHATGTDRS